MEAVRIIKEMRNATKQLRMSGANDDIRLSPRIAIWENVPGAFSSNNGEDFRCVLEELARIENPEVSIPKPKKWMPNGVIELPNGCISWRTHDAQYWGVPQRRRRISLVVDFRDEPRPEIQFIPEGLSRNIEQSEQTGEEITGAFGESADTAISFQERAGKPGGGKGILIQTDHVGALSTVNNQAVLNSSGGDISGTLDSHYYKGQGEREGAEREYVCIGNGQTGQLGLHNKTYSLDCMHEQQAIFCIDQGGGKSGANISVDQTPTLTTTHQGEPAVCQEVFSNVHAALNADDGPKGIHSQMLNAPESNFVVTYGVTAKGNGDAFLHEEVHTSLSTGGGEPGQGYPCVCYGLDRASFNQGQNAKYDISIQEDIAQPLVARGPGGVMQTR